MCQRPRRIAARLIATEIMKTKANNVPHIALAPRYTVLLDFCFVTFFGIEHSREHNRVDICARVVDCYQ